MFTLSQKMLHHLSIGLTIFGSLLVLCAGYFTLERWIALPIPPLHNTVTQNAPLNSDTTPVAVTISSLSIDLPIIVSPVLNQKWPLQNEGVSMVRLTDIVTNNQQTTTNPLILYGHNWPRLLGSLKKIGLGDTVSVRLTNGDIEVYKTIAKTVVSRTDTAELLKPADAVIYTCTGWFDSQRLVVRLEKKSSAEISSN